MQRSRASRPGKSASKRLRSASSDAAPPDGLGRGAAAVGSGFLAFEDFERILRENPRLERVELSNYGEILPTPPSPTSSGSPFSGASPYTPITESTSTTQSPNSSRLWSNTALASLSCSIDGASQASYSLYRIRGDFDRVMANIKTLNAFKESCGSELPRVSWQFVVFGHNEDEIGQARRMAAELGMDFRLKLSWGLEAFAGQGRRTASP